MPRKAKTPLPQPMFGEPVFNENGTPTPDPTTFRMTDTVVVDLASHTVVP